MASSLSFAEIDEWEGGGKILLKKILRKIREKVPSLDGVSVSLWPPSFGISLGKRSPQRNMSLFIKYVEKSNWRKEIIDHKEIWVCEDEETYQIVVGDKTYAFSEPWTQVYPAAFSSVRYSVFLKIGGSTIKEVPFISCDGGRIFVPMPKIEAKDDKHGFYWNKNSLGFKIGKIIGEFYIYKSIEGIAKRSNIEIR